MDLSALALASSVLALMLALVLSLALRRLPDSDGARLWALAFLPLSAGLALRWLQVETTMMVVLRDPLVLGGFALLLAGLRQYLRLPRIWLLAGSIVLASLVASALFTAVWPLPELRQALRLSGVALLCLGCVSAMQELREPAARRVGLFLQGVFGLLTLLSLLRLALLVPQRSAAVSLTDAGAWMLQVALLPAALLGLVLLLTVRMDVALTRLSMRDEPTGLLNRRGLDEAAHTALAFARRVARPVGLLLCRLDPVEALDGDRDPARGDEAAKAFAALLQEQFDGGDLAACLDGTTFAVLLPGAGPEEALQAAEALREGYRTRAVPPDGAPPSLSIGLVSQPASDTVWTGLLVRAEAALAQARARGGDACVLADEGRCAPGGPTPPISAGAAPA